jgi:hypothetical protein
MREKARHGKEAYALGGEKALKKGKWPCLTQDQHMTVLSYLCDVLNL